MIAPTLGQGLVIDRRVGQFGGHASARRPADLHGLEIAARSRRRFAMPAHVGVGHAAADLLDDLPQRDAHRHFDQPAAADLAGQGEDLRARALRRADLRRTPRRRGGGSTAPARRSRRC